MKSRLKSIIQYLWRHIILTAIFVVVLIIIADVIFSQLSKPDPYKYATATKQTIKTSVSASGIINGKNSSNLKFGTGGKIIKINVAKGDQVKSGQTLTYLDTTSLTAAVQQAENTLRSTQAAVDKIVDDTHQYQYGNQTSSGAETFTLRQNRTAAEVARDNAYDSVKSANRALSDAFITAPYDSTVTAVNFVVGQNISAADIIISTANFSKVYFEADVDESDIGKISLNQRANITLNAYGDKIFSGLVADISPITKTTANGATVVTVKIDLTDTGIAPVAGLNGQAEIILAEKTNVLGVPQEAIRSDSTVMVKDPQGFHSVKVTTGLKSDSDTEINSGLSEGQTVITNPPPPDKTPGNNNPINRLFRGLIPRGPRG